MDRSQALNKIKKLLALADPSRGGTASEVEAAMQAASRMMREHDVAMSDVAIAEEEIKVETATEKIAASKGNVYKWEKVLVMVFEQLLDVKALMVYRYDGAFVRYFGAESEAAMACEMYSIFHKQIKDGTRLFSEFTEKRSYCLGYALALLERARKEKASRRGQYNGTQALVYVGRKESAVMKAYNAVGSTTEKTKRTHVNSFAFTAGSMAGMQADMGCKRRIG